MGKRGELTPKQHEAIVALLTAKDIKTAAKALGLPQSTLYSWLNHPLFKAEYRKARAAMLDQSLAALGGLAKDAVSALKRNLKCDMPAVEVRAAVAILDKAIDGMAMADMQAEIEELRAQLDSRDEDGQQPEAGVRPPPGGDPPPQLEGAGGGPDPGPPPGGPDVPVPGHGDDPGPVAGAVPPVGEQAGIPTLQPPGWEEYLHGGQGDP